jgi:hypothetical protein
MAATAHAGSPRSPPPLSATQGALKKATACATASSTQTSTTTTQMRASAPAGVAAAALGPGAGAGAGAVTVTLAAATAAVDMAAAAPGASSLGGNTPCPQGVWSVSARAALRVGSESDLMSWRRNSARRHTPRRATLSAAPVAFAVARVLRPWWRARQARRAHALRRGDAGGS